MAIHATSASMVRDSLKEMLEVSIFCVGYRKNPEEWSSYGCYGIPAAILLLSIVDSIGSYVMGGGDDVGKHFEILNHKDYYGLGLTVEELKELEKEYRNLLNHNAVLGQQVSLEVGYPGSSVYRDKKLCLSPFLEKTKFVVDEFFKNIEVLVPDKVNVKIKKS